MKRIAALFFLTLALIPGLSRADVGEAPSPGGTFEGSITAIEQERDAITVENADKIVKMFSVTPAQKQNLQVGQNVKITYADSWQWPLKTIALSNSSGSDK